MIRTTKECRSCGQMMQAAAANRKYCPDCAKRRIALRSRANQSPARAKARPRPPALTLEEVARRAEAEGVSYGVYVARHGLAHAQRPAASTCAEIKF